MNEPEVREREGRRDFATNHASPEHREKQRLAEEVFNEINVAYWEGGLSSTRFGFAPTHPRSPFVYEQVNSYGAISGEMVIHPGFALAANPDWVPARHSALGFRLAFRDVILKLGVEKACRELPSLIAQAEQESFIAVLTKECNRIGISEGLGPVLPRRRPADDENAPVVAHWPFTGRELDYYREAITPRFYALLRGESRRQRGHSPAESLYRYYQRLLNGGEHARLNDIFQRQMDRAERSRLTGFPRLARVEHGRTDVDGVTPLSPADIQIEASWLRWENYLIAGMIQGIAMEKRYDELPIVADALEDAGCTNACLLRHLRAEMEHTKSCWAVTSLTQIAGQIMA